MDWTPQERAFLDKEEAWRRIKLMREAIRNAPEHLRSRNVRAISPQTALKEP